MTCGVFASILSSFVLFLVLYFVLYLVLLLLCLHPFISLSFFVLLHCFCDSLGVGVVSFSLSVYTQKERAHRVGTSSLGVLFCRSNSCNVVKKLRCRCFGFFQFVRFILPANTTGVGRLAGSHLNPFRHNVNITDNPPAFLK